ncbi:MAG: hypothetical protein HGB02_08730 [Chlorobiaceae bacterium]|nr:hypothetical protein [Chlorobiaceae bacterium]
MINLPHLAERLQADGLLNKSFMDCTKTEILAVCQSVLSSIGDEVPADGWKLPYIAKGGELVIPLDCHPDYRWWQPGGKTLRETLQDLKAPWSVARQYIETDVIGRPMTEALWNDLMTAPF